MNRRLFLQLAGGTSLGVLGSGTLEAASTGPFLDRARLEARNRDRSTVACQNGLVCASQPLAAMAGVDVLKAGGNCVDAAIAANAVLGLTEPAMCGIGGDLFAILWLEGEGKLVGLNASGRSPRAFDLDAAHARNLESIPRRSAMSWTVPGCVSGWGMLNERFGKKSLRQCLEGAIEYARSGFPLSPIIASHFEFSAEQSPDLASTYHPNGHVPRFGEVFENPGLARSYRQIAEGGVDAFYRGEIAERIVASSRQHDGLFAMEDLAEHRANWIEPVSTQYRDYRVWELPPNGQGIAALQMLNLLEHFDIASLEPNGADHLHLLVEAKKLVFEDRAWFYADPERADVPTDWLISKEYAAQRVKKIDPKKAATDIGHGDPALDSDTVYLTAADGEGNMISLIQSLYSGFGSTICPEGVGFAMQNRGQSFSLDPGHRNRLEPQKRPFHTIIPAFVTRESRPVLSFGVMGGDFQPQGHVQVLNNMIDFAMSPQQAGDQPRLSHDGGSSPWRGPSTAGGLLRFERGFSEDVVATLAERGHVTAPGSWVHGGYQAIWRRDDPLIYFGGSDPRKDGAAIGW